MKINQNHLVLMSVCLASYLGSAQLEILLGLLKRHQRESFERFLLEQFHGRALKRDISASWSELELERQQRLDALVKKIAQALSGNSRPLARIAKKLSEADLVPAGVRGMIGIINALEGRKSFYFQFRKKIHETSMVPSPAMHDVSILLGDCSWEVILLTTVFSRDDGNLLAAHIRYLVQYRKKIEGKVFLEIQRQALRDFKKVTLG